ncbi:MAG: DUF3696 domain-containing protein [Magnetococcales bacterium]|nr:DUF3696 domain-containing protein [Magnetococcales bacterium]
MIQSLRSEGFKGIDGHDFPFRPLTVLTGTNCAGKSSVIQAILLARMAFLAKMEKKENEPTVPLNDCYDLRLGKVKDIVTFKGDFDGSDSRSINTIITCNNQKYQWGFVAENLDDRYLTCSTVPSQSVAGVTATGTGGFTYLSAMRSDQSDSQNVQSLPMSTMELGSRGEFLMDVLWRYGSASVEEALRHPKAGQLPLMKQVEHWLGEFITEVALKVEYSSELDMLGLRYLQGGLLGEWVRPSNTGFGLSYCLPIVVAGLMGKPGSLLIIDSPEAHLHPAAQSLMGQFLARLAAVGIQTVIETHSDHVINGIHLAALLQEHPLQRQDVVLNFLTRGADGMCMKSIEITPSGALSEYPDYFFDQSEKDLSRIIAARRNQA